MKTIVVSGFSGTSLGIVRCLCDLDVDIVVIGHLGPRTNMPLYYSSIPKRKILLDAEVSFTDGLIEFAEELDHKAFLMLAEDRYVVEVAKKKDAIVNFYQIQLPASSLISVLMDKDKFHALANKKGWKVPKSLRLESVEKIDEFVSGLTFPCVVKPYLLHSRKVTSREEFLDYAAGFTDENWQSVIAEQWIPGGDDSIYFCLAYFDQESKLVGSVTGKKVRQWRPQYGTTSLCTSVENLFIAAETERIFSDLDYVGFGSIEFKYHAEEDSYYIMEPTVGRYDQQIALSAAAGVNLPRMDYEYLSRRPIESIVQRNDVWWIHELADLASRFHSSQSVKESYLKRVVCADTRVLLSWRDPFPLVFSCVFAILAAFTKARGRFSNILSIRGA